MRSTDFKLVAKHYILDIDPQSAREYKLKQDQHGYYLPQWNTSGAGFDRTWSSLRRMGYRMVKR